MLIEVIDPGYAHGFWIIPTVIFAVGLIMAVIGITRPRGLGDRIGGWGFVVCVASILACLIANAAIGGPQYRGDLQAAKIEALERAGLSSVAFIADTRFVGVGEDGQMLTGLMLPVTGAPGNTYYVNSLPEGLQ